MPEEEEGNGDDQEQAGTEHQQYLDERKELVDAARESARTFDKAVLTFGSAVFGFSIAFLKEVAPHPVPTTLLWLGSAWFCFAFGLLLILLSFLFSHRACMFEIDCATRKIVNPKSRRKSNRWSTVTEWFNYICVACLFVGLLLWSVFAMKNIGQEGNEFMKRIENPPEKKGYVPPPAPAKPPVARPATSPSPSAPPAKKQ